MEQAAVGIAYLDGPRLIRCLSAAADWVDAGLEELNRINVFPVPDGDTGTNFSLTLRSVVDALGNIEDSSLPNVTSVMAETCVFAARGNSGMLLSHFLVGVHEVLGESEVADANQLAVAFRRGAERLYSALDEPVEGTILTVCRESAQEAAVAAETSSNLRVVMQRSLERARDTLNRTPELLASLKRAGVVDAGGLGFVRVLEGVVRLIEGDPIKAAPVKRRRNRPSAASQAVVETDKDFRFCTEVTVRGDSLPGSIAARENLREFGGSIVVLGTNQLLKVHIHTDTPDRVFELAASWGTIEKTKADDMRLQHEELHEAEKNDVAIVVDSSCDLPDEIIDEFGMVVVPIQVMHDGDTYLDRIDLRGDEIYRRMIEEGHIFTTSQPTPGAFAKAFEDADNQAQNTLGVLLSAGLSGTFASAQGAARAMKDLSITLVDSRSVSIGLGMQALRAAELAEEGWDIPSITSELARIRPQCGGLFTVDTFENLLRSGRVSRGRAWLGSLLDIKPILEINREGRVVPLDRVRGRDALMDKVMEHLEERLTPRPKILRMAVVHANAPEAAEEARTEVVARFQPRQCFFGPVTAALGVHAGPGAWGVFYQVED